LVEKSGGQRPFGSLSFYEKIMFKWRVQIGLIPLRIEICGGIL
jgi:hypothetical protein